ncbi:MAG: rod shape-determining protein MreC [Firmicutes bacterium]|nr:rod shape-determining protein MreC [Bacillota bacterium]
MSFLKNKIVKITLAVIIASAALAVAANFGNNPVQRVMNTALTPIYGAIYDVITPARKFFGAVSKSGTYEKKISELEQQVTKLETENKSREDYIAENRRLKELLDLKEGMSDYKTVSARVVSYEPNSWYDTVMLDKGTNDGIETDDVVITKLGVAGKVISTGTNWAKVSTIINTAHSVGVKLSRTGDVGVASGDASLAKDKQCKLEYLSNDKNLITGDILVTSGLGGIYPPDLPVGKIIEIKSDSAGNLKYGVVEPNVDFSSLYEVLVITYWDSGAGNDNIPVPHGQKTGDVQDETD